MSSPPSRLLEASGKKAELFRSLESGRVQCTACARGCQIGEGQVGLCGIRGVVNGELYLLNYGKIIAGQIDPIEKKPVIHYRPGSKIFSIATTGCNWLCRYCFSPETPVLTDQGILSMERIFNASDHEDEIGYPRDDIRVISHEGKFRRVLKLFRHSYEGELLRIRPFYLPEIRCTPNHGIFVYDEEDGALKKKRADELTTGDYLVIPKSKDSIASTSIDTLGILQSAISSLRRPTSRPSVWTIKDWGDDVRFGGAKTKGIPRTIPLDKELSELLGIYCAEGSATRLSNRPNSWNVTFSFGTHEYELIDRTQMLLEKIFRVKASRVHQGPELRLQVGSAPLGVFLHSVAGGDKYTKRVPEFLLHHSSIEFLESFLHGYILGDGFMTGHKDQRWMGTTSVSRELSLGVWYMMLRLQLLPRFYVSRNKENYVIQGRHVNRHHDYMTRVVLAGTASSSGEEGLLVAASKLKEIQGYILVPIRTISKEKYQGKVYNMEVEEDHSYSASFVAVSNCQNSEISQRRKVEGEELSPAQVADLAASYGCEGMAYTYNEPSIFIEYARDVGRVAHDKGLFNIFVSNGYDTPETVNVHG